MVQRGPLNRLEPTTDTLRVRRTIHCATPLYFRIHNKWYSILWHNLIHILIGKIASKRQILEHESLTLFLNIMLIFDDIGKIKMNWSGMEDWESLCNPCNMIKLFESILVIVILWWMIVTRYYTQQELYLSMACSLCTLLTTIYLEHWRR